MSFMLRIAATPVPGVRPANVPDRVEAEPPATVSILASGLMEADGAEQLLAECRRLFAGGADTIVIDCGDLTVADDAVRGQFVDGIVAERALTHHVFVRSLAAAPHASFARCRDAAAWLMPLGGTDADLPRRNFETRSPLKPS